MNIDAQDNQDGRLLQETLTRVMIVCGFEDVREHKPAVSGKILCILCIDVIKNLPVLDYEPVSSHQAQAFVSDKSGPRPPRRGGSFESETGFVSNKLSIPLQPLFFQSVEPDLRHPNPGVVSGK